MFVQIVCLQDDGNHTQSIFLITANSADQPGQYILVVNIRFNTNYKIYLEICKSWFEESTDSDTKSESADTEIEWWYLIGINWNWLESVRIARIPLISKLESAGISRNVGRYRSYSS